MSVIYKFPYDSPVRYLPLVYLLPCDLISRFPTLRRLPRSMGALNAPEWGEVILSQQFFGEITDAVASLVFPHFGFGGWKEHYTGYSPVWRLSYALPLWAKGVERVGKLGVQTLFSLPAAYIIPFPDPEKVRGLMKLVVEQTIEEQGWGPMLEVVREMPCDEDFEKWDTNVRKDFLRKWYHTRSSGCRPFRWRNVWRTRTASSIPCPPRRGTSRGRWRGRTSASVSRPPCRTRIWRFWNCGWRGTHSGR